MGYTMDEYKQAFQTEKQLIEKWYQFPIFS